MSNKFIWNNLKKTVFKKKIVNTQFCIETLAKRFTKTCPSFTTVLLLKPTETLLGPLSILPGLNPYIYPISPFKPLQNLKLTPFLTLSLVTPKIVKVVSYNHFLWHYPVMSPYPKWVKNFEVYLLHGQNILLITGEFIRVQDEGSWTLRYKEMYHLFKNVNSNLIP